MWAFAALLWLVVATEARAEGELVAVDGGAVTVGDPLAEATLPAGEGQEEPAPTSGDPALPVEPLPVETPPPPAPEPSNPPPPPVPVAQPPAPAPAPPPPAPELPVAPPPAVTPPPPVVPAVEPTPPAAGPVPVEAAPMPGSPRESIVTISQNSPPPPPPPPSLPLLLQQTETVGGLVANTWTADRLRQHPSRSDTTAEGPPAAGSAGTPPLPPPLPLKDQAPSNFFVSGGGVSGGSSGGFAVGMLAALIALLAVTVQLLGSLVSLKLAPPQGNAFALRLIRPG